MALVAAASAAAAADYQPSPANQEARRWFQDARFGLFVHWGVYSILADGEWVMHNRRIRVEDYEKLPGLFNPTAFDPAEWVAMAKSAGMKYITITSKHHDGFAMWGTKQSQWNIVDATPYHRDPLKMLAEECHRQGIKLFFYHSQLDWHNPDYFPLGKTGHASERPSGGDFHKYLDYMDAQLRELLTGYGDIAGIWFDGMWDKPDADWQLNRTYSLIHSLQPAALVGSNHHLKPFPGEDFQMFEKDLPGQKTQGFNDTSEIGNLPLETCDTISGAWGYNSSDHKYKSTTELIQYLVKAAGNNANFLLNIGPRPDGTIQPEFVERLRAVGEWTGKYGDSIYGTRGGPISPRPWGVTTKKGSKVYVHILNWQDEALAIPGIGRIKSARVWPDGPKVEVKNAFGPVLRIPSSARNPIDTIVEVETGG
jgi:alpha-L-fucosidase